MLSLFYTTSKLNICTISDWIRLCGYNNYDCCSQLLADTSCDGVSSCDVHFPKDLYGNEPGGQKNGRSQ